MKQNKSVNKLLFNFIISKNNKREVSNTCISNSVQQDSLCNAPQHRV